MGSPGRSSRFSLGKGLQIQAFCYIIIKVKYRGVEQLVARRAHNPEVVRFKSHPRNQKSVFSKTDFPFAKMPENSVFMRVFGVFCLS